MNFTVKLPESELTEICRITGLPKKGPAIRKSLADTRLLQRRARISEKFPTTSPSPAPHLSASCSSLGTSLIPWVSKPNDSSTTKFHSIRRHIMKPHLRCHRSKGFALVITLSLMVLLTILAVGLLTLSGISLRSTSQGQAMAEARANARLAMMMALGELQRTAGPDRRVTAPANLVKLTHPEGITGVWQSWKPVPSGAASQKYVDAKTGANFLGYLMSNPDPTATLDPQTLPSASALGSTPLVSTGSLGSNLTNREISAPLIPIKGGAASSRGGFAWTVLDEGVKSRIDLLPAEEASGVGESITQAGTPARNRFIKVDGMEFLDEPAASLRDSMPKLVSLNEAKIKASNEDSVPRFFNDFTVCSSSLQADVANGGLKTDLSVLFDGEYGTTTLPTAYSGRYLYSNETKPFENATSDSQWELYANYARLYRRTNANDNPKDGLKATLPVATSYLKGILDTTLNKTRYEPDMSKVKKPVLMPTVARVDMVFSLVTRPTNQVGDDGVTYRHWLHLMYLPVITLHNPYSVPLRCTDLQVEFKKIPIGFQVLINGQPSPTTGLVAFNKMYIWNLGDNKTFNMTLSNSLTGATEVVMKPGETKIFGTPFPKDMSFQNDLDSGGQNKMDDWDSARTGAAKTIPGLITGPNDAVGFDLNYWVPDSYAHLRSTLHKARKNNPSVMLLPTDNIQVRYGPLIPADANNTFGVTVRLNGADAANTQFFYANETKLKSVLEEGTSPRFPEPRAFPTLFPAPGASPINTLSIYELNDTPVRNYAKARPFAIFSVAAKTTVESFTKSRPVADTGAAFQMATCDFNNSTSQGTNPLEFAFVPVKNGGAAIESGGPNNEQGFLFGGNGTVNGVNAATLYEIPMAPLQSIAQLRHANGGSIGSVPYVTYTVGESRAHPAVPAAATFFKADASRTVLDHSWLANDRLWDGYWFSTLSTLQGTAYTGASSMSQKELADQFFAGTKSLPNRRNITYLQPGKSATDASTAALTPGGKISAAHIMTQGGFNVNSTSVPAWIAVLSGLSESNIPLATGTNEKSTAAPFLRVRRPAAASSTFTPREKLWNGYRSLTPIEVKKLAEEIVAEIRTRGPFLSMSEFVNRRLEIAGDLSNNGAIQAALDRSNVNANMAANALPIAPADVAGYGWKNPDAVTGNTGAGAPGEITQGDVLSAIGSFVSVRSDTFRIRSYGDARDAAGKITARAYCETIVQRIPEYLDPAESADAQPALPSNILFGRQFKIISFRWLAQAEI